MPSNDRTLRQLLWLYFFLLIFEGALRKWIFPGLAAPLLLAREPVCIAALMLGYHHLIKSPLAIGFIAFGILGTVMTMVFGHGNIKVTVFGARIWLLHFPMIFLFSAVFTRADVWKFAKVSLLIAIPMTVLLGMQFYTPPGHILNIGVAGEGTSAFTTGVGTGRFRCSGTFSFTNGLAAFYCLTAALFAGYLTTGPRPTPKWIWVAGACLVLAMPLAISRTIAFSYALTGLCTLAAAGFSPKLMRTIIPAGIVLSVVIALVSQTQVFDDATDAFSMRWEAANRTESQGEGIGGVIENRIIGYTLLSAFHSIEKVPIFGMGIGMGTNVGSVLLTGERAFLLSEGSWGIMLGELGPIFGLMLILYRTTITGFWTLSASFMARAGNPLPLILGSVALIAMFMGGSGQVTDLGFIILSCGLFLASMSNEEDVDEAVVQEAVDVSNLYAQNHSNRELHKR